MKTYKMDKNYVDRGMPLYSFFKEKKITVSSLKYEVLDVVKTKMKDSDERSWEIQLICHEVNKDGTSKYGAKVNFSMSGGFLLNPSIIVHEMENLEFNTHVGGRISDLISKLVQNMPYNEKLSKKLREYHSYKLDVMPDGEKIFGEIKEFVGKELAHLK